MAARKKTFTITLNTEHGAENQRDDFEDLDGKKKGKKKDN